MRPAVAAAMLLAALLAGGARAEPADPSATVPAALPGAPPLPADVRSALARALAAQPADYVPRTKHRRPDGTPLYTNRLLLETSPYLRQHAHNPVDWRPWGDEAFAAAKKLGRPVLVSIGYSTCHWCHVMEEESFDDPEIARLLNAHFVAIKVDREVRPDVDAIYMTAAQAMQGRGGWPLNVFVTPERRPFFAGTYFPPEDRDGRPGFPTVLRGIQADYSTQPEKVEGFATRLEQAIQEHLEGTPATATQVPGEEVLETAAESTFTHLDWNQGGMGQRTKFPSSVPMRFLLRYHRRSGDPEALRAVELTLRKMAAGGIYDHVGGGFHRYSVDPVWLIPHFEKMLYDNARLALLYLEAWQVTGNADLLRVAHETLRYVQREMTSPEGGFYSATDADSPRPDGEMEEGWFFAWSPAEIDAALGPGRSDVVKAWYGVTAEGNFESRNVLHTWRTAEEVAAELGITAQTLREIVAGSREELYAARSRRPPPLRDDKVLAAWNGLMISAFARAALATREAGYLESAERAADFALRRLRKDGPDGRLRRVHVEGRSDGPAFLEDYAFLIAGLLDLYEASPDARWLRSALELQALLDLHYADDAGGGYFATADDHEALLAREKPFEDGAEPSGNSVAALNLLRLADLTTDERYRTRAVLLFSAAHDAVSRRPLGFGELLVALDYHHDTSKEIVLVRPPSGGDAEALLAKLRPAFVPNRVLSVVTQGPDLEAHAALVPLVKGKRSRKGQATAYVCENRVCKLPTADPAVFAKQITRTQMLP